MDLKEILEFVKEVDDLTSLEIEEEGFKFKLKKGAAQSVAVVPAAVAAPAAVVSAVEEAALEETVPGKDVVSPLVGIFHELEGDKKIKVGDKVSKGQVVCNVEAMKLMNEVVMPEDGEITAILVEEGDTVEFDMPIFKYI